ncbi:MAG: glycosyltransferase family 2 protein [Acidobacteriota bacterium]
MISIVIPSYNRREFLLKAVRSVIGQTFQEWELLVVDDGSTDGTAEPLEQFSDGRIRYHYQPRQGVSKARNSGVGLARFPWIAFLDSDDRWMPQKLQLQMEALKSRPVYRIAHTEEIWMRHGKRVNPKQIHRKYGGWIYHRCLPLCVISPSSAMIHRQVLEQEGLFDESLPVCEDYDLWLRICCRRPVLFLEKPLVVKYGGHAGQLSKSRWGMDRYRLRSLIGIYESGKLSPMQRVWTSAEIVRKAGILASGCRKRGKVEEAGRYEEMVERFISRERRENHANSAKIC